jgi:hypothetical protein
MPVASGLSPKFCVVAEIIKIFVNTLQFEMLDAFRYEFGNKA